MPVARTMFEGTTVYLELDGKAFSMPWETALELASALRKVAQRAEEYAKANQLIADGAVLLRAGVPFTLSNNPAIKKEVVKEAQHNRDLRRFMKSPSISSLESWGVPRVVQPRSLGERIDAMSSLERAELRRLLDEKERIH